MIKDKGYIENWAKGVVTAWQAEIDKRGIRNEGVLRASFQHQVISQAGGDVQKIKFLYQFWGVFVKLGVGSGQTADNVKDNSTLNKLAGKKGRRPKNWKDKVFREATQALYAESFRRTRAQIRETVQLPGKINLKF